MVLCVYAGDEIEIMEVGDRIGESICELVIDENGGIFKYKVDEVI